MNDSIVDNYCSVCRNETKHDVLFSVNEEGEYGEYKIVRQCVECLGCENKSFREEYHNYWDTIEDVPGFDEYNIEITNYPNILKGHTDLKNRYNVPESIRKVYDQTILAFKGKSHLLAGVGFRAAIEAVCIQEKIRGNNLEIKINNLAKNRLITDKEAERLHSIRFIGNDSIHEMEVPTERKLFLVLEIIETLLKNLYIIDAEAKSVLDTIIKDYSDFEDLLWRLVNKTNTNDERTLKEILGKHIRRINFALESIEHIVIERIKSGDLKFLKLGEIKIAQSETSQKQHYFYTGIEYDDLPF